MNSAATPAPEKTDSHGETFQLLWEELACAIAASQAALFSGRFQDLEAATVVQQEICSRIKAALQTATAPEHDRAREWAEHARQQNVVLAATVRRMQSHLDTLRSVLAGPSPSYAPVPTVTADRTM